MGFFDWLKRPLEQAKAKLTFDPGEHAVQIRYRNFRGEEKTFTGDHRTLRRRGNHLSLLVAPAGLRVALCRDRILNLSEVEPLVPPEPTQREKAVMSYHLRRRTTSPMFEQIRGRWPNWTP